MAFLDENFMLYNKVGKKLFYDYAKDLEIIDYHCHLIPKQIAENKKFKNVTELMLGGDHYKWRAMRSCGIDEEYITGGADDREKFRMFAKTVSLAIGNPLYHWTHLELSRYFGIDIQLNEKTADEIFDKCNQLLSTDDFTPRRLIERSNVKIVCTTDTPLDDLEYHKQLAKEFKTCKVLPTFRPDLMLEVAAPTFLPYIEKAGITTYERLLEVISERIEYFHQNGCRISDHALTYVPFIIGDAKEVFEKAINKQEITAVDADIFRTALLSYCASEYVKRDWTMQLHIGALRNNNTPMFNKLGPDVGFDSIADNSIATNLSKLLNSMHTNGYLPKTILYNLNPKDNYVLGTMLGNFQSAPYFGKIQFGSGWWFNDQRDGMEAQLKTLANLGVLSTFVGMLTDSRSLISYPRHEYFRRILCNLIGSWVENGEYPEDYEMLGKIISGICLHNSETYFGF